MFKCEKCEKTYKTKQSLNRHMKNCGKPHICKYCNKEFKTGGALGGHIGTVHSNKSMNNKQNFKCEICNKEFFTTVGTFQSHLGTHDEDFTKKKSESTSNSKKEFFANEEKSKDYRNYLSKRMKGNTYGKDNAKKISESLKKYFENLSSEEFNKVVSNFINAPKKGNSAKHSGKYTPTKIEQMIIDLNIDGLEYNGNKENAKAIRFENKQYKKSVVPDFIYKNNTKFIETFGGYWHPKEDEEKYIKAYNTNGYDVLILWEEDLYNNFDNCKEKIYNFLNLKREE